MKEYIGILDSGVGGLSVLSELYKAMPDKNYIFFGDTKNMPYGTKTVEQIYSFTKRIIDFFIENNVKNVVFACNTTSATVYDILQKEYLNKVKIFPLIQPVAKYVVSDLKDKDNVVIFATRATVNAGKYSKEIYKTNQNIKVYEIDCTGFVEIVEKRLYKDRNALNLIELKLDEAKKYRPKRIVLGCTHYPYLVDIFKSILPDVEYFNPASCLAEIVKNEIGGISGNSDIRFCVSKNPEEFKLSGKMFFDIKNDVELVN